MRTLIIGPIVCLCVSIATIAAGQRSASTQATPQTPLLPPLYDVTGVEWKTYSPDIRLGFVLGAFASCFGADTGRCHGVNEAVDIRLPDRNSRTFGLVSYGDVVKAIDRFYDDPANLQIPASYAIEVYADRLSGRGEVQLKSKIDVWRKMWKGARPNPPKQ